MSNIEIVESLGSLYPLKDFEEEAIMEVVAEFREMKEKATAKKVVLKRGVYHCPLCGMAYAVVTQGYCTFCGQHMN